MLMFEMLAGRSPFDVVGNAENPDQNTEDYLFQSNTQACGLYKLSHSAFQGSYRQAFAHGAMGRRIDPSWGGPIELFLVPASAPRLV